MLREIDARIAVEVFGMPLPEWTPTHAEVSSAYFSSVGHPKWHDWPWEILYWGTDQPIKWEPRRFSTEIGSAWLVVEKMKELGWSATVIVDDTYGDGAMFEKGDSNGPNYRFGEAGLLASGDEFLNRRTAPEAICIAARAALSQGDA